MKDSVTFDRKVLTLYIRSSKFPWSNIFAIVMNSQNCTKFSNSALHLTFQNLEK